MEENEPKIIKICDLLKIENLSIPDYQDLINGVLRMLINFWMIFF